MIKLAGFMPDADPTEPGVITACANLIPTPRGMAGGPTPVEAVAGLPALAAACRGAAVTTDTAGVRRTFAGTQTKLYELSGAAWTDRSRAGDYTGSPESRWIFAPFGNLALASDGVAPIQSSSGLAFADIASAPVARIIVAAKDFVLAFDTVDGSFGDRSDAWWCSAFQNAASWAPSVATQATTGRLVGVPGAITAAAVLGPYVVAYKENGAYLGQYVGAPVVWQWDAVPSEFGCVGPEAVCEVDGAHIVVGPDDIYLFDGTRPRSIAEGSVRDFFRIDRAQDYRFTTIAAFDRANSRVWIFYAGNDAVNGRPNRALVYHLRTQRWGVANRPIEAIFRFTTPGASWDTLTGTWDSLSDVPWDSATWQAGARALAFFDVVHQLRTLNGVSEESTLVTGDYGDDWRGSFVRRVSARFTRAPASSTLIGQTRTNQGAPFTAGGAGVFDDNAYDIRQAGRWHRFSFGFAGEVEVNALDIDLKKEGRR
jgi:hypothetical protein